jgi:uncharacterized protein (TIGR03492 family)
MADRLLVLSNGHGEDLIARRILEVLKRRRPDLPLTVLPLVGVGDGFTGLPGLQRLGPVAQLPSGGFANQNLGGLLRDLAAGLLERTVAQRQAVRRWARGGGAVLAVGDLLPLLLAWDSGRPYGFVGTPKSDYTWLSGPGRSPLADRVHACKGSEWDPWEWALMGHRRCRLCACRDGLTARGLRRRGVAALAPGNPMMDGFPSGPPPAWLSGRQPLLLLPGSRDPEARGNLRRLLDALACCRPNDGGGRRILLLPTGGQPSVDDLASLLQGAGFRPEPPIPAESGAASAWQGPAGELLLHGPGRFSSWAPWATAALACAGTATEQCAGLGVPALSLPGPGPQFQEGFARRQSRLLGGAVTVCTDAADLAAQLDRLLNDPDLRRRLGDRGRRRMGPAGGSERLAGLITERLLAAPA